MEKRKSAAIDHNNALLKKVENDELPAAAALEAVLPLPEFIPPPTEAWCKWFRQKSGWSLLGRAMENSAWLPFSHPDMVASRQHVRELLNGEVHPALILNVDQVWRRAYDNKFRFMHKSRSMVGQRSKRSKVHRTIDKKAHFIGGSRRSVTVSQLHMD